MKIVHAQSQAHHKVFANLTFFSDFIGMPDFLQNNKNVSKSDWHFKETFGSPPKEIISMWDIPAAANFSHIAYCKPQLRNLKIGHELLALIGRHLS